MCVIVLDTFNVCHSPWHLLWCVSYSLTPTLMCVIVPDTYFDVCHSPWHLLWCVSESLTPTLMCVTVLDTYFDVCHSPGHLLWCVSQSWTPTLMFIIVLDTYFENDLQVTSESLRPTLKMIYKWRQSSRHLLWKWFANDVRVLDTALKMIDSYLFRFKWCHM